MTKIIPLISLALFLLSGFNVTVQTDISLIDINHIGAEKLAQIKSHEKVDWWVEIGDKMMVSFNDSDTPLLVFARILSTQKAVGTSNLAFKSFGHCSAYDPEGKGHSGEVKEKHNIHQQLDAYFSSGGYSCE